MPRLRRLVTELGGTEIQARRLMRALYAADARLDVGGPVRLEGVGRELRERLESLCRVEMPRLVERQVSRTDAGTIKLLLSGPDGASFETVLFRNRRAQARWSLCVSSQAGCRMACPFCATGRAGLLRQLTSAEIVAQLLLARREVPPAERIANVVLMGMGEPLDNVDAVLDACDVFHDNLGFGVAADKIVLSTCGHVPGLRRLAAHPLPIGLAVSLHAADDALRDELVPLNRRYPLAELLGSLRDHPLRKGKFICFEYVLLKGVNDSPAQAAALGPLLAGLRAVVQVIGFNPVEGIPYEAPTPDEVRRFAAWVRAGGVPVAVRASRGPDIDAACGQLRGSRSGS